MQRNILITGIANESIDEVPRSLHFTAGHICRLTRQGGIGITDETWTLINDCKAS